jgi:hypothetical protein
MQHQEKLPMDTTIAVVALIVSAISLGLSVYFWRRSFRPIVTAMVKTHDGGNVTIAYDLVILNSGTIPAKNIRIEAEKNSLASAFGGDASETNKERCLACFNQLIPLLHNNDRITCFFGTTRADDAGFWKYKANITITIFYEGWFGNKYSDKQRIQIRDSNSFTGYYWGEKH